ncbi:hypothetical protein CI109_102279 [Kwoniella shandongensis]|uniref:F-box domain-containing protein n=1 Tax=Kwoniella shandongensis TaxID=1734106 RepID=A0AAJ8LIC9_9TREE
MSKSALAKEYKEMGMEYWKEGDYEQAWKNFDKALNFTGKDFVIMDYKAAAMCKMPAWRRHALEVSNEMIRTWPQNYKCYYRRAAILYTAKRYDGALTTVQKAINLGPTQAQNQAQYTILQSLRSKIIFDKHEHDRAQAAKDEGERARQEAIRQAARKARINYIHRLSPDVLLCIAEHGMADQPGFVSKMSSVCKSWRGILVNQKSLWNRLVLGRKRVMDKVRVFTERTEGKIMEIAITADFDTTKTDDVAIALRSVLKTVRRLSISSDAQTLRTVLQRWKGRFRYLEYLRIECLSGPHDLPGPSVMVPDVVCGLLDYEATSLRHLELEGCSFRQKVTERNAVDTQATAVSTSGEADDNDFDKAPWTDQPFHLSSIKHLSLVRCQIYCALPLDWSDLVQSMPLLTTLHSEDLTSTPILLDNQQQILHRPNDHDITLAKLESYSSMTTSALLSFENVSVPSLKHVDLWRAFPFGLSNWFAAPGWDIARPSLISLDLGHCVVNQHKLLGVLSKLPGLKFLNVSYCALDNTFLEALERKGNPSTDLLPNLTALSIAGNLEITSGPLRRLVLSRLPGGLKRTSSTPQARTSSTRGTAFRPTAPPSRSSPFAPSRPKPPTVTVTPIASRPEPVSTSSQTSNSSSQATALPSIAWLCIDHCERIESEAPDALRRKVRFVSHNLSAKPVDMRIRGKGRWAWDAEYTGDCGQGESGCMLRRTPGTRDGWHVHHTCGINDVPDEEPGWTKSQIPSSQMGFPELGSAVSTDSW